MQISLNIEGGSQLKMYFEKAWEHGTKVTFIVTWVCSKFAKLRFHACNVFIFCPKKRSFWFLPRGGVHRLRLQRPYYFIGVQNHDVLVSLLCVSWFCWNYVLIITISPPPIFQWLRLKRLDAYFWKSFSSHLMLSRESFLPNLLFFESVSLQTFFRRLPQNLLIFERASLDTYRFSREASFQTCWFSTALPFKLAGFFFWELPLKLLG